MPTAFSLEAIKFLRGLKTHNDRDWFEARRATYERTLREPLLALVAEINEAMTSFAPAYVRPPQKTAMRIYRDIRFSKNKQPYKTHVSAWWARAGLEKTSGGGFYFDFGPAGITIAAGVYMPEREQLLAIRRHLVEHHSTLRKLLAGKRLKSLLEPIEGQPLSRPPKGFSPADPAVAAALDLLLCRQWGVVARLPFEAGLAPTLGQEIVKRFRAATPILDLLNAPLITALNTPARRPLF